MMHPRDTEEQTPVSPAASGCSRRSFLSRSSLAVGLTLGASPPSSAGVADVCTEQRFTTAFQAHQWERDPRNPILLPGGGSYDVGCCMNPSVVREGDTYFMFYAGADQAGIRRVCLATARVDRLDKWERHGALFEVGAKGSFDETWCVLPKVHRINGKWHLYYTGRSARTGVGLQAFYGIGLLTSDNLTHWERTLEEPVLRGDGFPLWPDNKGIAGGGSILDLPQSDGGTLYRMYYTLSTGRPHDDLRVNQQKYSVCAHSRDGVTWNDRSVVLGPREEADYENAAAIGLNLWPVEGGYRALYGAIGTRFGAYSICEARSVDGLRWDRGAPEDNLALPPRGDGWESRMTTYPNVIREGDGLRLFYCGNGYGATGIGTATAVPL